MVATRSPVFNPAISPLMFFFEIPHIKILKAIATLFLKHRTDLGLSLAADSEATEYFSGTMIFFNIVSIYVCKECKQLYKKY
jgi:hypothetical protein